MIELSHISKSFGTKSVLKDVSLKVKENEMICLIGSIGCGKSTLMRCVTGLIQPDAGVIDRDEACVRIGMVAQRLNLFPHLNVLHNLTLAPMHVLGMSQEEAESVAMAQLRSVGLAERAYRFPNELSMGQQQRVAIARSLVMRPSVLLLDEPMSALDPIATAEVMDVLRKLKREITMIMVTHNIAAAEEIADRMVFLHEGRIVEQGTPEELLHNPQKEQTKEFVSRLRNLDYEIQSSGFDRPELNARIQNYCNRFGLGAQAFRFVQLAVEELINVIPLDSGVHLTLSKHDDEVRMSIDARFSSEGKDYIMIDGDDIPDELSFSILYGLTDVMQEHDEGDVHHIHIELGQERLLLK